MKSEDSGVDQLSWRWSNWLCRQAADCGAWSWVMR